MHSLYNAKRLMPATVWVVILSAVKLCDYLLYDVLLLLQIFFSPEQNINILVLPMSVLVVLFCSCSAYL
jgi:hypothetical protein